MGGCCCCCASKRVELNNSSSLCRYPRVSGERQPLSSHSRSASALSTALLVDTNLDTSIPDTYRPPPPPIPYESNVRQIQTTSAIQEICGNKSIGVAQTTDINAVVQMDTGNILDDNAIKIVDCKEQIKVKIVESNEVDDELKKSSDPLVALEEEDVCPTCLEEYDVENPKIITKCEHHFHLACILEWMERSDTCPVCDKEMVFNVDVNE